MLPSRDEAKGIVVEAIQLLLPDAVFTLEDEQNVTNQAPGLTHTHTVATDDSILRFSTNGLPL
jgi:hypothetical protein